MSPVRRPAGLLAGRSDGGLATRVAMDRYSVMPVAAGRRADPNT